MKQSKCLSPRSYFPSLPDPSVPWALTLLLELWMLCECHPLHLACSDSPMFLPGLDPLSQYLGLVILGNVHLKNNPLYLLLYLPLTICVFKGDMSHWGRGRTGPERQGKCLATQKRCLERVLLTKNKSEKLKLGDWLYFIIPSVSSRWKIQQLLCLHLKWGWTTSIQNIDLLNNLLNFC